MIRGVGHEKNMKNHLHALDLVLWTIGLRWPPTFEQIKARWRVSRATAFRWRVSLGEVHSRFHATHRQPQSVTTEARAP